MFAVIFEVEPRPDRWDAYLAHAAALRPDLIQIDGFLDNRRYNSRRIRRRSARVGQRHFQVRPEHQVSIPVHDHHRALTIRR